MQLSHDLTMFVIVYGRMETCAMLIGLVSPNIATNVLELKLRLSHGRSWIPVPAGSYQRPS